jgi:hypothetical protein
MTTASGRTRRWSYSASIWAPVSFFLASAIILSALATEHILQPLHPSPVALNIARVSAYTSIGISAIGVVALVVAWAVAARLTFRWFQLDCSYRDVVVAASEAFWVLGAYAVAGSLVFLVVQPPPLTLQGATTWARYLATAMQQEPMHFLVQGQSTLTVVVLAAVTWALRRRIRCNWTDAVLTVGVGTALVGAAIYCLTVTAKLIGKL